MKSLVLCLAVLTGCQSWNVNAFGYRVPATGTRPAPVDYGYYLQASDKYQTKSTSGSGGLSTEEKWGVVLILGVAIGAGIAVAVAAN